MTIAAQCNHDWRTVLRDSENGSYRRCQKCRLAEPIEPAPQEDKPEILLANELVEIGVQLNIISGNDAYTGPQLLQIGRDIKETLARERESRKQAEAALAFFLDDPKVDVAVGGNPHYIERRYAEIRAAYPAKPIPQEPAERERGK